MLTDYDSCITCHLFESLIISICTVKGEHCHIFGIQLYKVDTLQFLLKDRGYIFKQLLDLQLH